MWGLSNHGFAFKHKLRFKISNRLCQSLLTLFWDVWDLIQGTNVQRPTKGLLNLFALLNARIVSYTCRAQTQKPHTFWSLLCMLCAATSWYNKRSVISHFLWVLLVSLYARTKCESSSSAKACAVGALSQNKLYEGSSSTAVSKELFSTFANDKANQVPSALCALQCLASRPNQWTKWRVLLGKGSDHFSVTDHYPCNSTLKSQNQHWLGEGNDFIKNRNKFIWPGALCLLDW